jgi:hypothetical protein
MGNQLIADSSKLIGEGRESELDVLKSGEGKKPFFATDGYRWTRIKTDDLMFLN